MSHEFQSDTSRRQNSIETCRKRSRPVMDLILARGMSRQQVASCDRTLCGLARNERSVYNKLTLEHILEIKTGFILVLID